MNLIIMYSSLCIGHKVKGKSHIMKEKQKEALKGKHFKRILGEIKRWVGMGLGVGGGGGPCVRGRACEWGTAQGGSVSLDGFKETGAEAEASVKRIGENKSCGSSVEKNRN